MSPLAWLYRNSVFFVYKIFILYPLLATGPARFFSFPPTKSSTNVRGKKKRNKQHATLRTFKKTPTPIQSFKSIMWSMLTDYREFACLLLCAHAVSVCYSGICNLLLLLWYNNTVARVYFMFMHVYEKCGGRIPKKINEKKNNKKINEWREVKKITTRRISLKQ